MKELAVATWIFCVVLLASTIFMHHTGCEGAAFTVVNQCPYTVWAAASPGGGAQLQRGQGWTFNVGAGTIRGRVWGRTNCNFNANGQGSCQTGDCGGKFGCEGYGQAPATLAEYALNQFSNQDFYDISLVDGFNIPMSFVPLKGGCTRVNCNQDLNSICPAQLRAPGACKSACDAFGSPQYCCTGSYANKCGPTDFSRFFKGQCPQAYSYAKDHLTSTFICPSGGDYKVVFCG